MRQRGAVKTTQQAEARGLEARPAQRDGRVLNHSQQQQPQSLVPQEEAEQARSPRAPLGPLIRWGV